MNPATKWTLMAVLAAVAGGYFAVVVWRATSLARVLLRKGYSDRGFDERGLATRVRVLGWIGLAIALVGLAVAASRAGA